ncbi:MAG TPA: hypothetical protein DDW50_06650 [Firmicutes bacterium]|nr:hypothetical protein [Bacillota bacterium]
MYSVVITCCAADGMPVGLLVNLPLKKIEFSPEEWVGVEGTIQFMPCDQSLKNIHYGNRFSGKKISGFHSHKCLSGTAS